MTENIIDLFVGSTVGASPTFTNDAGVPTDPTTVVAYVRAPNGTVTTYEVGAMAHPSTGVYALAWGVNQPGRWHWRFETTGTVVAAVEGTADVLFSRFKP